MADMTPPFQQAYDYYGQAANAAMPSPESLDKSAARLRARTDTNTQAAQQQTADQYAGRGQSNSGGFDYARMMNQNAGQQAYASGYGQLEDDYAKQRQAGSQILSGIGQNYGNTANQQGQYGIANRQQNLSEQLDPRKVDIAQQQATTDQYSAATNRSTGMSKGFNDFLNFMGTFGNTQGQGPNGSIFDQFFQSGKQGLLKTLGLGLNDWPENPHVPGTL